MNNMLGPNMQEYLGQILQLQRGQTAALESIAESLVKLANPPAVLQPDGTLVDRETYTREQAEACASRTPAEDDEYQGG